MRKTLLALLLIAFSLPALAVGKVTTDPNAPGAAVTKEIQTDGTDARLSRKVTYSAPMKTVSAILEDLTKSTGIVFRSGVNSKDWQVRDRKMTISVKDVPLSQLMNSISRVMKFKWQRGGSEGAWTYRLYMDRKTLLDAEAQRVREEEKAEAAQAKKRADGFAQYAKLAGLTDADKLKLKSDNPFLYMAATSGLGDSMGSFFREVPSAGEAIASGQRMDLQGSALSPAAQAGLMSAMRDMTKMEARFGGSRSRTIPDTLDPSKLSVSFNETLEQAKGFPGSGMLLGDMSIHYDGGRVSIPFIDPQSGFAKVLGQALIQSEEEKRPMDDVMKEHITEFMGIMTKEMKADAGGESVIEHPDDPALKEKVTLKPAGQKLADVEMALADATKLGVVSDNFSYSMPLGEVPTDKTEIKAVLDKIGEVYIYNWDKHASILELRDRNWFKKRAAQIPEAWLETWHKEMTDTGTIDIDSLAQIAQLTQEQYTQNVMSDEAFQMTSLSGIIFGNRDLLKMYGTLSADQRAALMSKPGMDLAMLSQGQFAQVSKLIQSKLGSDVLKSGKTIAITCVRKAAPKPAADAPTTRLTMADADKGFVYTFSLTVDGQVTGGDWRIITPSKYTFKADPAAKPDAAKPKPADGTKPADGAKPADAPKPATDPDAPPPAPAGK